MSKYKELEGIDGVFYLKKGKDWFTYIDMTSKEKVGNTGGLWCKNAYGDALVILKYIGMTDVLYLMDKEGVEKFKPISMSKEEQEEYLKRYAKRIVTREGIQECTRN